MAEFIDRKVAIEQILDVYEYEFPTASGMFDEFATKIVPNVLKSIPAADVVPVAHGTWIEKEEETYCPVQYGEDGEPILHKHTRYFCNLCGRRSLVPEPYCHCGAKMERSVDNEQSNWTENR